ncbi:E3 ubiquitin-protein ligase RNF13 [Aphelenchoides fujianensis]|nr:E3 ubiquitin-protein ligase RNF13 [Aphelenchoides fujianensis]
MASGRTAIVAVLLGLLLRVGDAQYLVEILEHTSFETQRVVHRCDATGATFGESVVEFSMGDKAVGCAVFAEPRNACGPVVLHPLKNESMCDSYFAIVSRGNCSFSEKAFNVQNARPFGFDALVVYNYDKKQPIPMSSGPHAADVTIPVTMMSFTCMKSIMGHYSAQNGYLIALKGTPGYYDLVKEIPGKKLSCVPCSPAFFQVPFVVIVGFCFCVLFISLIIRLCRERRRLARKRLSRANLRKLPVYKYKMREEAETCAICLEDFRANDKVRELPCRHLYHQKCIDPWLTTAKVCPICKRKVGPSSNGEDSSDSESERTTTISSLPPNSRDVDPLIRNAQPMPTSDAAAPPTRPTHNIRWFQRRPDMNASADQPTTSGTQTAVYAAPHSVQADDEQRPPSAFSRLRSGVIGAMDRFRQRLTPVPSNAHSRLDNDDSLSNIGLDPEAAHSQAVRNARGNENTAFDSTSANSLTTVCSSNRYSVPVEVESPPADPDHHEV